MIELSKNYVALNMAKFIYEEEVKAGKVQQSDIKDYIFNLYEECLTVVEENDSSGYGLDIYDIDDDEATAD